MSTAIAAPTTSWNKSFGWYKGRRMATIRGQAVLTHGSQFYTIPIGLPPRCKPVWSAVFNQTAIDMAQGTTTDATNAANAVALCFYPAAATATVALTTPATGSASAHTNILCLVPSTASQTATVNQVGTVGHLRCSPLGPRLATNVQAENPQNLDCLLLLRPANTNSQRVVAASAATNTDSNMVFGTSTATNSSWTNNVVNVVLYYEEFDDPTSAY
jgi:hypothetical protein